MCVKPTYESDEAKFLCSKGKTAVNTVDATQLSETFQALEITTPRNL